MSKTELKTGDEVTINIPFTYTIGEIGYYTNKVISNIEDAKEELRAEIDENNFNSLNLYLEVKK